MRQSIGFLVSLFLALNGFVFSHLFLKNTRDCNGFDDFPVLNPETCTDSFTLLFGWGLFWFGISGIITAIILFFQNKSSNFSWLKAIKSTFSKIPREAVFSFLFSLAFIWQAFYIGETCQKPRFTLSDDWRACDSQILSLLIPVFFFAGVTCFFLIFVFIWRSRKTKVFSLLNDGKT